MLFRYIWVSQNINDTLETLKLHACPEEVLQLCSRLALTARGSTLSSPMCFNQKSLPFVDAPVE